MVTVGLMVSALVILVTMCIAFLVYVQTERQIEAELARASSEIVQTYLLYTNGAIALQNEDAGESLSVYLRNVNVSLYIRSRDNRVHAAYGLYRTVGENGVRLLTSDTQMDSDAIVSKGIYRDVHIESIGRIDTYTVPLHDGTRVLGSMQIAQINNIWPIVERSLFISLLFQVPIILLLTMVVVRWGTYRTVEPLMDLVHQVRGLDSDNLPEGLRKSTYSDSDIALLQDTLESLLKRIRQAFLRQKQISQNVSHELKTPLTRIVMQLESVRHTASPQDRTLISGALGELVELGSQIDGLLDIAMHEFHTGPKDKLYMSSYLRELAARLMPDNHVRIDVPKDMVVFIPKSHARIIWGNILENASKYSEKGKPIIVSADYGATTWSVTVTNISTDRVETHGIFDRGKRGSTKLYGHGLGMSIVRDVCRQLGLQVSVVTPQKNTVAVVISGNLQT